MLNDIKTVQDLINLNEKNEEQIHEQNVAENIVDQILDLEPKEGLRIVRDILKALEDFHNQGVELYIGDGKPNVAATWASDSTKLRIAIDTISDIKL